MTEEQKNNANNWLKELFRRRVVQTIALYIAVAWGATEIFVTVQEVQGWPEWTARLVVAIFITGFPAALVLAWARDISSRALRAVVHVVALSVFAAGSYLVYQQGRPPGPPFASLVVIPFADLSADQEKDWFVTGLSHELRSTLAQVQGLLVIAETSADVFRGRAADVDAIGTELNVRHVLEGVVRRDDDQLRITANLIDTQDGRHVWSKSYNFVAANIFDIQTDISKRIAGALEVTLAPSIFEGGTKSIEAFEAYMRANESDDPDTAILNLEEAIRLDPDFADAYIGLADIYADLGWARTGVITPAEAWEKAEPLVARALDISKRLPNAYLTRGLLYQDLERYEDAEKDFKQALEYDPNSAAAYQYLGWLYRWHLGMLDEAVAMHERNVQVDPLDANAIVILGTSYWRVRRFEEAEAHYKKGIALKPHFSEAYFSYAAMMAARGRFDEALRLGYTVASYQDPVSPRTLLLLGLRYSLLGESDTAQALLESVVQSYPKNAYAHALLALGHYKAGDVAAATQHANAARESAPRTWVALKVLTLVDLKAGEPEQAVARLRALAPKMLDPDPDVSGWRLDLVSMMAQALMAAGDTEHVEALLRAALEQAKKERAPTGEFHALLGDSEAAVEALRKDTDLSLSPRYCRFLPTARAYEPIRKAPALKQLIEESCEERERQLKQIAEIRAEYDHYLPQEILEILKTED